MEQDFLGLVSLSHHLTNSFYEKTGEWMDGWVVFVPLAMPQSTSVTKQCTDGGPGLAIRVPNGMP